MKGSPNQPPDQAVSAGEFGLRYAAERSGLNLHSFDVRGLAENVLRHAIASRSVVTYSEMALRLEDEVAKTARWRRSWAAAVNDKDQVLVRISTALSALDDHALAERLARECGVVLPVGEDEQPTRP